MTEEEKALALIRAKLLSNTLNEMILGNDRLCEWTDYGLKKNTTIMWEFENSKENDD